MTGEPINQIVELIKSGMGLDDAHCVIYNQMVPMPTDSGIFVAVGILDSRPFAGSLSYGAPGSVQTSVPGVSDVAGLTERQTLNIRETLSIQMMSRDNSARKRRADLIFALTDTAACQAQEAGGFLIARLPLGFTDASVTENAERLNRYVATMVVLYAQAREGQVPYYDQAQAPELLVNP